MFRVFLNLDFCNLQMLGVNLVTHHKDTSN
jgi:hypothetical protein